MISRLPRQYGVFLQRTTPPRLRKYYSFGVAINVSRAGVGSDCQDLTRQDVEDERTGMFYSVSWQSLPIPAPHSNKQCDNNGNSWFN